MRHGEVEIREAEGGPQLRGLILTEGRAASGGRAEVHAPGSVTWPQKGIRIQLAHRQPAVAYAVPVRGDLGRITIATPATDEIRAAVESGRDRMSVEFHSLRERTTRGGVREVLRSLVEGAALVREAEFDTTLAEVRQRSGGFRTHIQPRKRLSCRCAGKVGGTNVAEIQFGTDAFVQVLGEVKAGTRNISAISRGAGDVVADTATKSLSLSTGRRGLLVEISPLDTEAGRGVRELIAAGVAVHARPVVDFPESASTTVEGQRWPSFRVRSSPTS